MSKVIEMRRDSKRAKDIVEYLSASKADIEVLTIVAQKHDGDTILLCSSEDIRDLTFHASVLQNEVQYLISTSYESE